MASVCRVLTFTALFALMASGREAEAQQRFAWEEESPGEETSCAFDTPYRFFHAGLAEATDLLIYFQGGGACWEWVSCSGMFDTDVTPSELREYRGIFDPSNEANPFRGFAVLFIPYCTGDVHVGDTEAAYGDRSVQHRGYRNAMAALDLAVDRAPKPERVVVSGASAGSYGAVFFAPEIVRRFASAEVVVLGDSGVPLLNGYEDVLRRWGSDGVFAALRGESEPSLSLVLAHRAAVDAGVERVAQITSDQDAIQGAFYLISGSPQWRTRTYSLLDSIGSDVASFRSFVVSGPDHGLMRTDRFYEYEADGVRLSDWIDRLITGDPISNRRCAECTAR